MKPAIMVLLRRAPFYGFRPGSNFWPMVEMAEDIGGEPLGVQGEDVMEAISLGYLRAEPLKEPILVLKHKTEAGLEADVDHRYFITRAGIDAMVDAQKAEQGAQP